MNGASLVPAAQAAAHAWRRHHVPSVGSVRLHARTSGVVRRAGRDVALDNGHDTAAALRGFLERMDP